MGHNPNYSEDLGYVNIHGQDVRVFVCEKTGRILVPIDELKDMGFRIYRKSQYSRLLIDDNQFRKEFDLYMLQSAQTYMLECKIVFKENEILESINRCKAMLTGQSQLQTPEKGFNKSNEFSASPSGFSKSLVTENSPTDITITTKLREPSASSLQHLQNDKMFKGFTQNKNPASLVNEKKPECYFETNHGRNSFEQRQSTGSKFGKSDSTTSFDDNKSFDSKKSSPRASSDNLIGKGGRFNPTEQRRGANFNQNGVDGENRRNSESVVEAERLANVELNKPEHNVLITHIEKQNVVWAQDLDNADTIVAIDTRIREEIAKNDNKLVKPLWNNIYLAQDDGSWYRCKPIKFKPLTVVFIDFGNAAQVTEVKEAPEELKKIPCQAVRLTFSESQSQYKPELFNSIFVKIKKFDRGTYAVEIINKDTKPVPKESPPTPSQKTFFAKPQPLCKLENGQRVMLIGHVGAKLALRTRECFDKLREIEKALEGIDPKPLEKVEKGQLVLCNKDNKLQRAVVLNMDGKTVEVELLDHFEKIKVDFGSLKNFDESLVNQAITYILTPPIKKYNDEAEEIITDLIKKKSKPLVVLSDDGFDLKVGDELLSRKFSAPKQHSNRFLLKDMKFFKPSLGSDEYILNVFRGTDELYFVSGDALGEHMEAIVKSSLEDTSYEPVVGEICFGLYQDSWSRCVIQRAMDSRFEVQFIDFGNLEFLKSDQLRKLTDDAKNTPILGIRCQLTGLPVMRNIEELIKQHVSEGESYEINIKKFNGEVYEIEMPTVYKELKASF